MVEDSGIAGGGIAAGAAFGGVIRSKASGPGFAFTQEQLQTIATKWETLADTFRDGQRDARTIANAEGPGAEYASGNNARLVRESGQALWDALVAREKYCREEAEKTRVAMGKYANAEDDATGDVTKQEGKF